MLFVADFPRLKDIMLTENREARVEEGLAWSAQ